jgi:hypothetical protein
VHDNDAADSEWSRIAELVRDAKEEALRIVRGEEPLTRGAVERARQAARLEEEAYRRHPNRIPIRVEVGPFAAELGYVDHTGTPLHVSDEEVADALSQVLGELSRQVDPGNPDPDVVARYRLPEDVSRDLLRQACADLDIPPELVVEGCEIVWEFRTLTDAGDAETIPDNEIAALREKAVRRVATAIDLPEVVVLGSAEEIRASAYTPPHDTNGEP